MQFGEQVVGNVKIRAVSVKNRAMNKLQNLINMKNGSIIYGDFITTKACGEVPKNERS